MATDRSRTRRNVLALLALLALTAVLAADRLGPLFAAHSADEEASAEEASAEAPPAWEGAAPPEAPPVADPIPLAGLSFQAYAERYEAVSDSFRARDQLLAEIVGRRVVWEGVLRNVSKQPRLFYVTVAPHSGYGPVSALITFPHAYEDTLYTFRRDDRVRFEGVVARAGAMVSVEGAAIARIGTAEVESALVHHEAVAEAAVVGYPHAIKGQGIYAYVTLVAGRAPSDDLRAELVQHVRDHLSPIAAPDFLQFAPQLPKTRSGKIMRRILRKIAEDEPGALGDTTTLADPAVVDDLVARRLDWR